MPSYPRRLLTDGRNEAGAAPWQQTLFVVIFKADTPAGKAFDVLLILAILASVAAVVLDTVAPIHARHGSLIYASEWVFTGLFTVEYLLRLACTRKPGVYARSFFGVVDLMAVLPTYLELLAAGSGYVLLIRLLRILRIFRVLKLSRYIGEADALIEAMRASRRKILIFIYAVLTLVTIFGSLMYLIEGPKHGFTSIPRGIYWSIVTLTTVGYGDITPQTPVGQAISALVMIMGYGIIAVPTGIYAAELGQVMARKQFVTVCPACGLTGHDDDAAYCKKCGSALFHTKTEENG